MFFLFRSRFDSALFPSSTPIQSLANLQITKSFSGTSCSDRFFRISSITALKQSYHFFSNCYPP